jgi:hypothetical protein
MTKLGLVCIQCASRNIDEGGECNACGGQSQAIHRTSFQVPTYMTVTTSKLEAFERGEIDSIDSWCYTLHDGVAPSDYYEGQTYIVTGMLNVEIPGADIRHQAEVIAVSSAIAREIERSQSTMERLQTRKTELLAIEHQPEDIEVDADPRLDKYASHSRRGLAQEFLRVLAEDL